MAGFNCFIIGGDSLLIECSEILSARQHNILGIISDTPRIIAWAKQHGIRTASTKSDYLTLLKSNPFDFLFSITHLGVLSEEVIKTPRKHAINFHDGPLPRYAGLNAPVWALLNREPSYGITWHVMTSQVDQGDILKQSLFDIAPGETALSLNTRCFEAGIESFAELVDELANGTTTLRKQDLSQHKVFARHDRPAAAGLLDWSKPAEELEALVRALDFGRYDNPVGAAKLLLIDEPFIVTRAVVDDEESSANPGTVVSIEHDRIVVATGRGNLAITGLATLLGKEVSVSEVAQRQELRVGQSLDQLTSNDRQNLTNLNAALCKSESFWVRRLSRVEPIEIPTARADACPCASASWQRTSVEIPKELTRDTDQRKFADSLASAFAFFVGRIGQKDEFDLAFSDSAFTAATQANQSWVNSSVFLRVSVKTELTFGEASKSIAEELTRVRQKGSWLKDVVARFPDIKTRFGANGQNALPVGIDLVADFSKAQSQLLNDNSLFSRPSLSLRISESKPEAAIQFDANVYSLEAIESLSKQFTTFLRSIAEHSAKTIAEHDILSASERDQILIQWNKTDAAYPKDACLHQLFEAQAAKTPDAIAVVFEGNSLTYRELNTRASTLAAYLRTLGVGPDVLVGLFVGRSLDLMVGALGIMKAGGAYVPLDPAFPRDRLAFMLEDSKAPVVVTQNHLLADAPKSNARIVRIDADWQQIAKTAPPSNPVSIKPTNLAYVIYTSGSTGKPKGVMVEHRNVVNFFTGMDANIQHNPAGTWLAVTTLSFDISVLELFWTLARGFKVVLFLDRDRTQSASATVTSKVNRPIDFSLYFWGNDDGPGPRKYELLLESARFGDANGFAAVWTPERHFHAFGGPYPNPSVLGAAVAAVTKNIRIRAGSCVIPLHHPIRVAEEWAVVDNLSNGRVDISFASGWQPHDFVLRPESFKENKKVMVRDVDVVRRLWRGESLEFQGPHGDMVPRTTLPRPVQKELPVWITSAGNPDTYRLAGAIGANVLTHLLGQSVDEVADKIRIYRQALADNGHDPNSGKVTLMLHTFVGENEEEVRQVCKEPLKEYLRASVNLVKQFAWSFPAFKRPQGADSKPDDIDLSSLTPEETDAILEYAFLRYYETSGLFGTPESCVQMIDKLKTIGVDDVACLIDFGIDTNVVLDSLKHLNKLRQLTGQALQPTATNGQDHSFTAQVRRHKVSHMQCTPSMARMLLMNDETKEALSSIRNLFIGGEAFPAALARDLQELPSCKITNMYGPTETTVWSTTHHLNGDAHVPIGRPIANTRIYIFDKNGKPVSPGVPGELFIGGDGVVRGYHNRAELTAERFVPDPFCGVSGARMYRTGDLARYRSDGVIEFLGRNDFQVKIRGYRIELGEIESQLTAQESVREAVVMVREDVPGDPRLVAYLVSNGAAISPPTLRESLKKNLPDYMVPSHFVVMDQFPLTPNGKVDRKALPAPQSREARPAAASTPPADEMEQSIAALWKETLGIESVGVDDNFFDIGGHSLLVVRIHRRLKEVMETPVALTDLYRFPTIRSFTEFMRSGGVDGRVKQSTDRAQLRKQSMQRRRALQGG